MDTKKLEDYEIRTVKELRDSGNLIASFLLCSAFIEHHSKTRLFIFITERRTVEIIKVQDKITKKMKNASIWSKMKKTIWDMNQGRIIELGLLVGAWNYKLYMQLTLFNKKRNNLVHNYENLLETLEEDEKEVRIIIEQGLSLLLNIKWGYVKF